MDSVRLITQRDPKSPVSEAYRTLRTNIQFSGIDKELKTIVFTSATPGEGKSTVASNLASSIALSEKRIIVIDCDLRRPKLHKIFGISNYDGLTSILMGEKRLKDVVYSGRDEISSLNVLTSGPIPPNPAELLASKRMKDFLQDVEDEYDMVILDCPPVGLFTDSAILSTLSDGTILVIESGRTDVEEAQRAKELLDKVNTNIIGVVLNKVKVKGSSYKYWYYDYANYYDNDDAGRKKKKKNKR